MTHLTGTQGFSSLSTQLTTNNASICFLVILTNCGHDEDNGLITCGNAVLNDLFLNLNVSEDLKNICLNFTTLFRFDSELCQKCKYKTNCKKTLKVNYPKLHLKRIAQKFIRNRIAKEKNGDKN